MSLHELFLSAHEKYKAIKSSKADFLKKVEDEISSHIADGRITILFTSEESPIPLSVISDLEQAGFQVEMTFKGTKSFLMISWY